MAESAIPHGARGRIEIIRAGQLSCRDDVDVLLCDVANQGALWNNPDAHRVARLYFRPRNAFHLKTEGIKSRTDRFRQDPHMAIPIAFAFKFVPVMCLEECFFVDGNFAKNRAAPLSGDENFDKLDFEVIYHDSPFSADQMQHYQNARMSEVVVRDRLSLEFLDAVICRTIHEERTLRHRLALAGLLPPPIRVEQRGSVFMRKGILIDEVYMKERLLHFRFREPVSGVQDDYEVEVACLSSQKVNNFRLKAGGYRVRQILADDPNAIWRITIEGCVAYEGPVPKDVNVVS